MRKSGKRWSRGGLKPPGERIVFTSHQQVGQEQRNLHPYSYLPFRPLLSLFRSESLPQTIGGAHTPGGDDTHKHTPGGRVHASLFMNPFPREFASPFLDNVCTSCALYSK